MSSTKVYNFETESEYNFTSTDIELVSGEAKLKLKDLNETLSEDFSSDVGFTYDSDKTEFSGGLLQSVDQGGEAASWFKFDTDENAKWADGSTAGSLQQGATYSATDEWVDVTTTNAYWVNTDKDNFPIDGTGHLRWHYYPDFQDDQGVTTLMEIRGNGGNSNRAYLEQLSTGFIRLTMWDSSAVIGINVQLAIYQFTQDAKHIFDLEVDVVTGATKLWINGNQIGATQTSTFTRTLDNGGLQFGDNNGSGNGRFKKISAFTAPQSQVVSDPPDIRYEEDYILSPEHTAGGSSDGAFQSIDAWDFVGSSNVKFTIYYNSNPYWYNGSEWEISDTTYDQSNTAAQILANESTFEWSVGITAIAYGIHFEENSTTQSYIDSLDIDYTHQIYSKLNPTISPAVCCRIWAEDFDSFSDSKTEAGSDLIKYILTLDGTKTYWNGSAWSTSNGTYSQSNTSTEISTNIGTLISTRTLLGLDIFLHSEDGLTTPKIDTATFEYDAALPDPSALPRLVDVNGYIFDAHGAIEGSVIRVRPYSSGFNNPSSISGGGGVFHAYIWKTLGTTVSDGYFSGNCYLQPSTSDYWEFKIETQRYKTQLIDKDANDLNELTLVKVDD